MDFLSPYIDLLEKSIGEIPFSNKPSNLYDPCQYILSLKGKRVRPVLTLLAHHLYDDNYKRAIPAALCVELFHNFSLIHDDIMDKAPLRRGQATVHMKWNESTGILSGDVLLVHSFKLLTDHYNGDELKKLIDVYQKTAIEVCEGQQLDMDYEKRNDVTVGDYENMIGLKTSVLLGCALKMGAITAGASETDANHVYEFGKNLGIAFQLRDDYLDAFGNPAKTGKQPGGDIRAGKKTFLMIDAYHKCDEKGKQLLTDSKNSDDYVNEVLELFVNTGADQSILNEVNRFQTEALKHLNELYLDDLKKKPLMQLADYLMNREH